VSERAAGDGVPDLLLERYRLGELPGDEADAVARREREDEGIRVRLRALAESDEALRRRVPPAELARGIRARLAANATAARGRAGYRAWPLVAAAAAAAVLVVLSPIPREPAGERVKGLQPGLALFRKAGERSESLADGDVARAGDLIRVGYRAAGRRFGVILSLDGRGHVTVHLPTSGRQAAPLQTGEVVLLEHAFELDDAPRWERFFFVTSETPFDVTPILEGARHAGEAGTPPTALRIKPPLEQSAFSLEKEMKP
jgi:hypothetical protein